MKSLKKESRLRIPTNRLLDSSTDNLKEKKRAKVPEQPTPPIQEEAEPISNVLQGDDILALAIKEEDLKKQHIPRLETEEKPPVPQKILIRKLKPKDSTRKICRLVAYPATPDAATKPLDYSGPGDSFYDSDQILPHHILGSLQDFKRIAVARGNTQLAELIQTPPCLMTLISMKEEPQQKKPKAKKAHLWAPAPQHNFLKNWQRHITLRKKQQAALSERLKKPVSELLMHAGETYRQIQEERELIDRVLPTQHDGKCYDDSRGFWNQLEYVGDEMTGLVMTKTKLQRGLVEPITHIRKPQSIREEMGLPARKDAWYRYTWDRSLFLIYRREELRSLLAKLDFSQQDIDGLEVVGKGQPVSTITVKDHALFENTTESSSEDTVSSGIVVDYPDMNLMPVLGPSLLFCGKPAFWIRGSNPQDKSQIGIAVRLTFETLEGEKTSSELTVVNNGTVAIWYSWQRQTQVQSFQELKRNKMQQFYFNNREGVILPGETKKFTFFFKSPDAGIFRESWKFETHPTLLGGAILQVNLHAISLTQDTYKDDRQALESKLAAHEAITVVESVLQDLLSGVLTPERTPSPVDTYLTEEDLFHHKNPRLHYQYHVVQNLHELWHQYMTPPTEATEAKPREEEALSTRAPATQAQLSSLEKSTMNLAISVPSKGSVLEAQKSRSQNEAFRNARDFSMTQKSAGVARSPWQRNVVEEIPGEESLETESTKSPWELESHPQPEWNLCLEDFRKAVMTLPDESQQEDALIRLNRGALELCRQQRPLQSDFLYQTCLQLWRDVIDSLVSYSLWLRALLGLPEKENTYLDVPDEQDRKSPPVTEVKAATGKVGKEDRKGASQDKRQLGVKDKEDKKGAKLTAKEERANSKKQKAKDDKKLVIPVSRERLFLEEPVPDTVIASQEPVDPLVMEKYLHRLHIEVYGLLDVLVTDMMVLADELSPKNNVEERFYL